MKKLAEKHNIAYFIITLTVMTVLPNIIFYAALGMGIAPGGLRIVMFGAALLYGLKAVGRNDTAENEESISALYFPVILPVVWQLTVFTAVILLAGVPHHTPGGYNMDIPAELIIWLSFNLWTALCNTGRQQLQMILITELTIIGGFFIGERIDAVISRAKRRRPALKAAAVPVYIALCLIISLCTIRNYELTHVEVSAEEADKYIMRYESENFFREGYGFPYENGWSSVPLDMYYVENENNVLAKLSEPSEFIIDDAGSMPVLDGAEAAYPVYSAFAYACYGNIAEIQKYAKSQEDGQEGAPMPVRFTNTVEAFKSLVNEDIDIFFGAAPSAEQKKLAEAAGKELILTPIGKEAFVFFVSSDNPVDGLTSEQLRSIYSGRIKNWKEVGGKGIDILAFQRPKNSGSQTMMEYFMGDVPLKEPLKVEFEASMIGVISGVADYQNKESSIGYSFRYYASQMTDAAQGNIKFLSLDGVYPDEKSISDGSYPMTTNLYAVTLADNDNPCTSAFVSWMTGAQGQKIVADTGYIANSDE